MNPDERFKRGVERLVLDMELNRQREATAWCYVVTDLEFDSLVHVVGPFEDQWQAPADSERARADMDKFADPAEPGWSYTVLPFWPPSEWKPG